MGGKAGKAVWSNQPDLGGPEYWIRNIGFNTYYSSAFKWQDMQPAGVVAFHKSFSTFNKRFIKNIIASLVPILYSIKQKTYK